MPKRILKTQKITLTELEQRVAHIEQILGTLKGATDAIEELGEDHVYVFATKSFSRGVAQINGFAEELRTAMQAVARGCPYTAKTKKSDL